MFWHLEKIINLFYISWFEFLFLRFDVLDFKFINIFIFYF
jgi:hypothetical protein